MQCDKRIRGLQEVIRNRGLEGAVVYHSRDVFYYTGTAQPSYLVVLPDEYTLFVRRGYELARRECGLSGEHVVEERSFDRIARRMFPGSGTGRRVGTEWDIISLAQARSFKEALGERELVDISNDILDQRMVKDAQEIENIAKACSAVHAGHFAALACLRPGLTELELGAAVENAQRLAGHEGCFFTRTQDFIMSRGPLASGPNLRETSGTLFTLSGVGLSNAVPTGPSRRAMERGDLVLIDIPACIQGYHADQSRTYQIGPISDKAGEMFEKLKEIADHVLRYVSPGMPCSEAFKLAQAKAVDLGVGESFMRFDSGARAHFIGHGIGLELNEPPLLTAKNGVVFKEDMVVALEMHLMEPDGIAIKLEDTVWVRESGNVILTESPRELIAVI